MAGAGQERTLRILEKHEKRVRAVYSDSSGYATIGIGHLITPDDANLLGRELSDPEMDALLAKDVAKHEASGLKNLKVPISENQRSALVSLAFNAGPGASRKIVRLINEGKTKEAADKFLEYNKSRNKTTKKLEVVEGLTERRKYERSLFLTRDDENFDEQFTPSKDAFGVSSQRMLGVPAAGFSQGPDAAANQNMQILAAMKDLNRRIGGGTDPGMEDFLNRLREEGRGAA